MRYYQHFFIKSSKTLISFLEKNHISYEYSGEDHNYCCFDLYSDQKVMGEFKRRFRWQYWFGITTTILAPSAQEMEAAEWFVIRSNNEKIQLKENHSLESFVQTCPCKRRIFRDVWYRHSAQVSKLLLEKRTKLDSRHFFAAPTVHNNGVEILFGSERTKTLLNEQWKGLEFWPVLEKNGKEVSDLYQLVFQTNLPLEAIEGGKIVTCKGCRKKVMFLKKPTDIRIKRSYLSDGKHVYRIGMISLYSRRNNTAEFYIVSKEFYQFCEKHQMNRGMEYLPVELVEK